MPKSLLAKRVADGFACAAFANNRDALFAELRIGQHYVVLAVFARQRVFGDNGQWIFQRRR